MSVNLISLQDAIQLSRTTIGPRTVRKAYIHCEKCNNVIKIKNRRVGDMIECSLCGQEYKIKQEIKYKTVLSPVELIDSERAGSVEMYFSSVFKDVSGVNINQMKDNR